MAEPKPIVCTLSRSELKDRGRAWQKLLGSGLVYRDRIAGGIALRAEPGGAAALMDLIDLERECCEWMSFEVVGEGEVRLTAEGAGEAVLAGMFVPPKAR